MMRRYLYLILASSLVMAACDKPADDGEDSAESEEAATAEEADQAESGAAKASPTNKPDDKPELTANTKDGDATVAKGAGCDSPAELTKFDTHTVLSAEGGGCFLISGGLKLKGGQRLVIEPGVTLKFAENAGLEIYKGALVAKGTADNPIVLTGQRELPGFWKGLHIQASEHTDNTLEHVEISYGGSDSTYRYVEPANLIFNDRHGKSTFKVHNSTFAYSGAHGLYAKANTDLDFAKNTLTNNKAGAAYIAPEIIGSLDAESTYSLNETDEVTVWGSKFKGHEATWPGIEVPYHVTGDITAADGSFVTIEPGATFKFAENTGLEIYKSKLAAKGSAENPVRFTGQREVPGIWKGIHIQASDSIDNALEYVEISYGGAAKTFRYVQPANLIFNDRHGKSTFKVQNSTFTHSGAHGLYAKANTDLDFAKNTLTQNKAGAALIAPQIIGALDDESTYGPNEADEVTVWGDKFKDHEATWPGIDAPYHVTGDITAADGSFVTIAPGATFEFDENTGLEIYKSKLMAKGSEEAPITFRGAREHTGFWKGIHVQGTSSIDNVFEHVVIEHAGSAKNFRYVQPAAIMFNDRHGAVSFRVANLTVRNSSAGLYIKNNVALENSDCESIVLETEPKLAKNSKAIADACK